jgi:hypothetical protein
MTRPRKRAAKARVPSIADPAVAAAFRRYPAKLRARLLALRRLVLETAAATEGVGPLEETLKWGQPSYLTSQTGSGSTIRLDRAKSADEIALYFHCQTDLVAIFRELYPDQLAFGGNRSIRIDAGKPLPEGPLRHCIALALTYHARKARDSAAARRVGGRRGG